MTRLHLFILTPLLLVVGSSPSFPFVASPTNRSCPRAAFADPVEGRYKWKAITVTPGIPFDKKPITDLLAFTMTTNPCIGEVIITFRSGGSVVLTGPAGCQDKLGVGLSKTSHWEHTGDTLLVTEADGKHTRFALRFSGPLVRLSGKINPEGLSDKKERLLTMELVRL